MKYEFNSYPTVLTFNDLEKEAFLKTLWGKGENAGTSIFSFFRNVFCPSQNTFHLSSCIYFFGLELRSIHSTLKFCQLLTI